MKKIKCSIIFIMVAIAVFLLINADEDNKSATFISIEKNKIALLASTLVQPRPITDAESESRRLYDATVKEVERKYPAINPDLNSYRPDFAKKVVERRDALVVNGMTRSEALIKSAMDVQAEELFQERQERDARDAALQRRYANENSVRQEDMARQARIKIYLRNEAATKECYSILNGSTASLNARRIILELCGANLSADILNECISKVLNINISINEKALIVATCKTYGEPRSREIKNSDFQNPPSTPMPPPAPSILTSCDASGCWDNLGGRYNKGAGNSYFRADGKFCQSIGGQMNCN
jgi:hypothetical protein